MNGERNPVAKLLESLSLSPTELAWATESGNSAIYDLRAGRLKNPPSRFLKAIEKLGVDPGVFESEYEAFREAKGKEVREEAKELLAKKNRSRKGDEHAKC